MPRGQKVSRLLATSSKFLVANAQFLVALATVSRNVGPCRGIICDQRGIFRVNCMDCLDRTNVV